jgi:hypothetical protein
MPTISINSLIANLTPGRFPSSGPVTGRALSPSVQDQGVVFTRAEPWRNVANGASRVGYSRQDARGAAGVRAEDASPPGAEPPPGPTTEDGAPASDKGGSAAAPEPAPNEKTPAAGRKNNGELLSQAELDLVRELQQADQAVKAHEMAHLSAAGGYARGGATYSYQRGPDGQNYAVGGEVQIDTGKERTPEATILKMQIIRQAALAPSDPSPQDQRVAAHATLQIAEASKELFQTRSATASQPRPQETGDGGQATADGGEARSVYQEAGTGLISPSPAGSTNFRQGYAAYRTPYPPRGSISRQGGVDQVA